jgi:hypothetical protein
VRRRKEQPFQPILILAFTSRQIGTRNHTPAATS